MKPKKLRGLVDQLVTNSDHFKESMQENTKMSFPDPEVFNVEYIIEITDFSEERLNQLVYWVLSEEKED